MTRVTPSGVVVVDKPSGMTSHDVVMKVRRALQTREVGHAGTLDPMATGVLVIAVGEATKLVPWLTAHDKAYEATIKLGVATASLDADGEVVDTQPVPSLEGLDRAIEQEKARTEQIPPIVSAIKVGGVASHALARRGEGVELPPRAVQVHALEVVRVASPEIDVRVACAKGYYVRSLARDLAAHLGTVGHLTKLRRTRSGPFTLADAADLSVAATLRERMLPLTMAAERTLGIDELTAEGTIRARHGKTLAAEHFVTPPSPGVPRAWVHEGVLVAVGDGEKVLRGFREP
ncbi:MAG: tRNA pseudouridine(55) synthase TruB [Polyangiales bacterium]